MTTTKAPTPSARFSDDTLRFLEKASRQKRPEWLDKNRDEYERVLLQPLQALARHAKTELASSAPGYNFPQKGIGRLRRPAHRVQEGGGLFKNWMSYQATTPSGSRFDHNPNLFFLLQPEDREDSILIAGGLYVPSSRQTRAIREAIAQDASAFDALFATKDFKKSFPDGFSDERIATRPPRGFDPAHPRMDWLKLQAFFVWKSYTRKEFKSAEFPDLVVRDWRQILRLNVLLEQAIQGRLPKAPTKIKKNAQPLLDRLKDFDTDLGPDAKVNARKMDF